MGIKTLAKMYKSDNAILTVRFAEHLEVLSDFESDGYVYLAHCDTGHWKIGISKAPEERVKHFDTIMPVSVRIFHWFPCDNAREAESKLHEIFANSRVKGEWFDLCVGASDMIMNIKRYINGRFENYLSTCNLPY